MTDSLNVTVVSDVEALKALGDALEDLSQDLCEPNVFYEPWMLFPALAHLGDGAHFDFVLVHATDAPERLCGFFPLVRDRLHPRLPLPVHRLWHHAHCFRCMPLIRAGHAEPCWAAFLTWFESASASRQLLLLNRLPGDGAVQRALDACLARRGSLSVFAHSHETAYLRRKPSADALLQAAMSGKSLSTLRRKQRRLGESGPLCFADVDADNDLSAQIDAFLRLEASGWKGKGNTAMGANPAEAAFFREVMDAAADRDRLSFLTLRLDGRMIAARTALLAPPGSFVFKIAYDESQSKHSPGALLELEEIRRMHDPENALRADLDWSDSSSVPDDGPFYRCWPERRRIMSYRIAAGFGAKALVVRLLPLLSRHRSRSASAS